MELLKFLVDSAVKLEFLVISPIAKLYQGSNNWIYYDISVCAFSDRCKHFLFK